LRSPCEVFFGHHQFLVLHLVHIVPSVDFC
jgi:hypothetical protein